MRITRAAARVMRIRTTAVHIARTELGARYAAGRVGPRAFDCSGLAIYVVKKATGRSLPHYSKAQFSVTKRVSRANLRPGDLVFFFRHGTHHVGIYIGGGRMISATNPRGGVRVDSVFTGWYGSRYSGAGRLV
jgi:cell wall-associated NlpC family hydrolase